jgi:hypothetical protein
VYALAAVIAYELLSSGAGVRDGTNPALAAPPGCI